MTELSGALLEGVVDRLTRPDYRRLKRSCAHLAIARGPCG
jgi:hypothetical protein